MNPLDTTTRAEREQRDQRIYDQVRGEYHAPPHERAELTLRNLVPAGIGAPIGTDRARALAAKSNQADRRPALTSARVRQLSALAELVRPRAKARSEMYGLPRHQADDIRRAIAFIDDLALWERRHR